MTWNKQHIEQLASAGKIRGYVDKRPHTKNRENYSQKQLKNIPVKKSKAKDWLSWNLLYWSNEQALTMETEYQFDKDRKWRFDYCWPAIKCALEYEGIFSTKSRHTTQKGYSGDADKYNRAAVLGWRVIRVTALNYKTSLKQLNELICKSEKNQE